MKQLLSDLQNIITTLDRGDKFTKKIIASAHGRFMKHKELPNDFKTEMNKYLYELDRHEYDAEEMARQGTALREILTTYSQLADPVSGPSPI